MAKLVIEDSNLVVVEHLKIANSFLKRFKGLMLKKIIDNNEGLLLTKTKQIHTFWMLSPIDVIYLKKIVENKYLIVGLEIGIKPWRVGKYYQEASDILEVNIGKIDNHKLKVGKILAKVP